MYHKVIIFYVICTNNVQARERETLRVYGICMCDVNVRRKKESNAEIRDDYPQSSLDQHIASDAGRDLLAVVDERTIP